MSKQRHQGQFPYTLKHRVVRDLKVVTEVVGVLDVQYVGYFNPHVCPLDVYERYGVDIDAILWNGTDIKPVLEVLGAVEDIEEATIRHFAQILESTIIKVA